MDDNFSGSQTFLLPKDDESVAAKPLITLTKTYYAIISLIDQNESYYQIFGIESVSYH